MIDLVNTYFVQMVSKVFLRSSHHKHQTNKPQDAQKVIFYSRLLCSIWHYNKCNVNHVK